jgi:transcription termination factor NusB
LPVTDLAVLFEAYSEFNTKKIDKKIIINESMKTAKKLGGEENKAYINAVLDKILK